jgi:hypothetical protein
MKFLIAYIQMRLAEKAFDKERNFANLERRRKARNRVYELNNPNAIKGAW